MTVNNVNKNENKKLTFQVAFDSAEFEKQLNVVYQRAKKDIQIPGFRRGKAPRALVENMYGKDIFYEDAINDLAEEGYRKAREELTEKTVGRPAVENYKVGDDRTLTVDYSVALYPEVTLGQYKGLEAYKAAVEVSDEEVDKEIAAVQKRNSRMITVDREAQAGDNVNIDFDGYLNGERFDGGKGENQDLVIGAGKFVPGFEEGIVGMKPGEEKDLDITFPEDYHADLAGKAVVFKIKLNQVKEVELPALDDDFAQDVSDFDTFEEYRNSIVEMVRKNKEIDAENDFRSNAIQAAAANMTVEIPEAMIEQQIDYMVDEFAQNCEAQGLTMEQYLNIFGQTEAQARASARPGAEQQVRNDVLLRKVAEVEGLVASDEEVEKTYQDIADSYGTDLETAKKAIKRESVEDEILIKMAAEVIYGSAIVVDKKPEAAEEAQAEEAPAAEVQAEEAPAAEAQAEEVAVPAEEPAKEE